MGEESDLVDLLRDKKIIRVSLDIDQTIALVHPLMIANFNRAKGTHFTVKDHVDWDFKALGSDYLEMMPFYARVWIEQWRRVPFLGDAEHIVGLSRYYDSNFLTTRSPGSQEDHVTGGTTDTMHMWLKMHNLSAVPVEICDPKQNKARDFDRDVYVDDSPTLAATVQQTEGKFLLLIDRRYNRDVQDGERVMRIGNVNEATKILMSAARIEAVRKIRTV